MNSGLMEIWELEIRECVRHTLADYTAATDRNRIEDVAACFAPTRSLTFTGGQSLIGPTAIAAGLNAHASVTSDRVEVGSYFLALTNIGVDHWGRYRDVLVPVHDRWLFAAREATADGFSVDSLMR
jgi:hypothetical protein